MNQSEVLQKLGITDLSDMQKATSDAFGKGTRDIVVLSPTGTGKTLAYMLPLVSCIDMERDDVQAVVIVPGRALALQPASILQSMGCGVRGYACYGGRMAMDEHRELRKVQPHIVFATPGRLVDHLNKGNISPYGVRTVVIDEFDKCLDMGFSDEMSRALDSLKFAKRRVLLSATDAESIPQFVRMADALTVDFLDKEHDVSSRISVQTLRSPEKDKLETLWAYLCTTGGESTIVFVNHRESVERIAAFLSSRGMVVSAYHGGLDQRQREAALYRFANGSANVMVCTDLGSRGLDIDGVGHVVHYHAPETQDACVHRTGRTARWDATGTSLFILGPGENLPPYVDEARETTLPECLPSPPKPRMATIYIGKGKKDKISRGDIVGFLCKKGGLGKDDVGKIDVKERYSYAAVKSELAARLLKTVAGEKIKGLKTVFELIK